MMFTQVIIRKQKTDGQTDDWRTDRHIDVQCETIIPRHYCVAGYNKSSAKRGIICLWQVKRWSTKTASCIIQCSGYKLLVKLQKTRAGVCKTLCPQLPDSNTAWLQPLLAHEGNNSTNKWNFKVILSKGNNSKIGDNFGRRKKIRVTYFFLRNQNMKFQNISIHGSKLMLYTIKQLHQMTRNCEGP